MITTVLTVRGNTLFRHTAACACAALAVTAVAAAAPAQAAARGPGRGHAAPARAAAATPRGREWAAFAYYPPKNELVLFGGRRPGTIFRDTWTRTGTTWTLHNPTRSPSARTGASMVFDPASHQLLLFGGSATTGTGFSNQTWTWNGSNWTQLHPATSPPGREDQQMAYDAATRTVILFAGFHGTGYWDDTWSWNGTTWTKLNPATAPSGRDSAAFVYDPATSQMILFGGFRGTGFAPGDTWAWNGTTWTPLSPAHSPGIDVFARQAAYDTASNQLLLFGGDAGHSTFLNTIWTWTGTDWTQLSPAVSPPPRAYGAMTFDSATGQVVLFSGSENALTSFPTTTWAWNGSTWSQI
jgi:Kelch motif